MSTTPFAQLADRSVAPRPPALRSCCAWPRRRAANATSPSAALANGSASPGAAGRQRSDTSAPVAAASGRTRGVRGGASAAASAAYLPLVAKEVAAAAQAGTATAKRCALKNAPASPAADLSAATASRAESGPPPSSSASSVSNTQPGRASATSAIGGTWNMFSAAPPRFCGSTAGECTSGSFTCTVDIRTPASAAPGVGRGPGGAYCGARWRGGGCGGGSCSVMKSPK